MSAASDPHVEAGDLVRAGDAIDLDGPRGWIQWKGSDACIDLRCVCGHQPHFDGEFLYYWQCSACGKVWGLSANIRLVEMPEHLHGSLIDGLIGFRDDGDSL